MIGAMVGDWPSGALAAILGNLEVSGNQVRNRLDSEHHRQILHSLWADDPVARYDAVRSSVHLMVAGRRSSVDVDRAARALADVTVSWHPDAHHDIHLQQPDVVAARLSDVVNRVRGSSL
jgi:hypothetical protein